MDYDNAPLRSWQSAEDAAREAEREVRALLFKRTMGATIEGLEAHMAAATALRHAAHRRLGLALKDMEIAAQALHHRNVTTPTIRPLGSPPSSCHAAWTPIPAAPRSTADAALPAAPKPLSVAFRRL